MQRLSAIVPRPVSLVPTMGAIHEGHLALVKKARRFAGRAGTTITSLFVNPIQFGPGEDYQEYPRTFRSDCALLDKGSCDFVFAPTANDMYLPDSTTTVLESTLSQGMCGASRPGHFAGVCTVVSKLFHIVRPDFAIFGEKDYQQLAVLRRMVRDLNFPVRIVSHPIVREADGLALSSRNRYLSDEERKQAAVLYATLLEAEGKIKKGWNSAAQVKEWIHATINKQKLAKVDYVVAVEPVTLKNMDRIQFPVLLAVAVFLGSTRLIDNRLVK